ncbi:MAG: SDR family oxidoreductase [Smithellaceae bacterium]|jgi:NAD(P)-dependent dehydrogenase (short-subunit alcohol dehydrogenase family)|nr:SDR family oxidoreductase [Syntrophaceae bacterium]HOM69624.1 SDR family oxidoreductase [Smithellaceae bacterium]
MSNIQFSLKDRVALITGGSQGIGRAIALAYAGAGARIAITARSQDKLKVVKSEIEQTGQKCLAVPADLSVDSEIKRVHDAVLSEFGAIDILVNNAGIGYFVALSDLTSLQFHEVMTLNVWAALHLSQLCYPGMKDRGKGVIINMASTGGIKPDIFAGAYSASKSALIMITKQIASEWGQDGIRCVAICPGLVRTEMAAPLVAHREQHGFKNLVNRAGEPEEVAALALFLASDAASFCQGAIYLMDGGSTVGTSWG